MDMDAKARGALATIQACIRTKRYVVLPHFKQRMEQRGLVWPDVLAVLDDPAGVRADGRDRYGRPKWIASGTAADGGAVRVVCAIDRDDRGNWTIFITAY
jgi:hypothetical protein